MKEKDEEEDDDEEGEEDEKEDEEEEEEKDVDDVTFNRIFSNFVLRHFLVLRPFSAQFVCWRFVPSKLG